MNTHVRHLTQSRFARNVAIVASGTAGAQAIMMIFTPVITRLYGPEAFGVLGTFTALLAVVAPVAALSYPIAIVLPRQDSDALGLGKLSMGIALATSLLTALVLLLFENAIVSTFNLQTIESFLFLIPLAMFFSAALAVMNQWVIRKKLFNIKARMAVLQALWINLAKAGVGLVAPLAVVLIALTTVGSALHAVMLWLGVRRDRTRPSVASDTPEASASARELAWRHRDFACYRTPQTVLNAASQSMPVLMLASFFGPTVAGLYTLARLALGVPSTLIGNSVAEVFYPRFVETLHAGKSGRRLIIKSCSALSGIGAVPYLVVFALGPLLFGLVFGESWTEAGTFARWMSVWLLAVLVTRPIVASIPALDLQREFLLFEIISIALRFASIAVTYYLTSSAVAVVAVFSLTNVVIYLCLFLYVLKKA